MTGTSTIGQLPRVASFTGQAMTMVAEPDGPEAAVSMAQLASVLSFSGKGPPMAQAGIDGSFYFDTENADDVIVYGPKRDGVWPAGVSLKGKAGAAGNVAARIEDLRAADIANGTIIFEGRCFQYQSGDYSTKIDDVNYVASNYRSPAEGAWDSVSLSVPIALDDASLMAAESVAGVSYVPPGRSTFTREPLRPVIGPGSYETRGEVRNLNNGQHIGRRLGLWRPGAASNLAPVRKAMRARKVKAVFVGDSMTECLSQIGYADAWVSRLTRWVEARTPGVAWQWSNLGIAGRDIGDLRRDSFKATNDPNYDQTKEFNVPRGMDRPFPIRQLWPNGMTVGKSWHEHAQAEQGDIYFFCFGLNGTSGDANAWAYEWNHFISDVVRTWTKPATIVLVTSQMPTRKAEPYATLNAFIAANADVLRGVAAQLDIMLVDVNRLHRAYREGIDVVETRSRMTTGFENFSSWQTVTGSTPVISNGVVTFSQGVGVSIAPRAACNLRRAAVIAFPDGGYGALRYRTVNGDGYQIAVQRGAVLLRFKGVDVASALLTPKNSYRIYYEAIGARHRVWIDGNDVPSIDVYDYQNVYPGQYGVEGSAGASVSGHVVQAGYGAVVGGAHMDEDILLGPVNDYLTNPFSLGGNAINHATNIGHLVYLEAFEGLVDQLGAWALESGPIVVSGEVSDAQLPIAAGDEFAITINGSASSAGSRLGDGGFSAVSGRLRVPVTDPTTPIRVRLTKNNQDFIFYDLIVPTAGDWWIRADGQVSKSTTGLFRHGMNVEALSVQS